MLMVVCQQLHGALELAPAFLNIAQGGYFKLNTKKAGASLFCL
jgi:hypothetical protein